MMKRILAIFLSISLILCVLTPLKAQEIINSATGQGYGGSGSLDSNAAWLTGGTAIRVFPTTYNKQDEAKDLAKPDQRYRFLPFSLYLFPEGSPSGSPVHYNLHLSPDGQSVVRSSVPYFDMQSVAMADAFRLTYEESLNTANPRKSPENLFVLRMLEVQANGKGFQQMDWSIESNADLIKSFFFSDTNPLSEEWLSWFGMDWAEANRTLIADYIAAVSFAYVQRLLTTKYKCWCPEQNGTIAETS